LQDVDMNSYMVGYASGESAEVEADAYQRVGDDLVFHMGDLEVLRVPAGSVASITKARGGTPPPVATPAEAEPPCVTYSYSYSNDPLAPPELVDIGTNVVDVFGYPLSSWKSDLQLWQRILHPEDFSRVVAATWKTTLDGVPYLMEYRIVREDGVIVWVRDTADIEHDEIGDREIWRGSWAVIAEPAD
jgi:hypothetical protein